jgi:P-type Ca2+ transporter type 2C
MYYSQPVSAVLQGLKSSHEGMEEIEAKRRLGEDGFNELPQKKQSLLLLFVRQFNDILVYILLGALILSAAMPFFEGEELTVRSFFDAFIILAILILNAILGFVQEYKAEEAISGLQKLSSPHCRVRRGGIERIVPSREIARGDIVIIEAGDRISADGRLIEESHLEVNESSLTGESLPSAKGVEEVPQGAAVADQTGMVFTGTLVTRGSGEYVVTATGTRTQLGAVAQLVSDAKTQKTPLEERMERLSKMIGVFVLGLCSVLVLLGVYRGMSFLEVLIIGVSLAVSAVPEGLPAVVTVCLALGVRRMTKANVIVRKLQSLETLGSVTVICSDKTGTITENRMKVREVWVDVPSALPEQKKEEELLVLAAASCNRAKLPDLGDPTEIGLLEYAAERGIERLPIDTEDVPFTSEEKYMQTRHRSTSLTASGDRVFLKGAPEKIVALCTVVHNSTVMQKNKDMASRGLRVLGCAVREGSQVRFVGLIGMEDPPRAGIPEAVNVAKRAGIRTIMITGDNLDTALAIAKRVGIEGRGLEGKDLDALSPEQLLKIVRDASVYARVSPEHKVRILQALQANREIVAMSGDGVNDAPALKGAHVGVAMGRNGTEVAREAASIVLTDDNYATIVSAVREGRHLYDNIQKFILFLMHTNFYELVFFAVVIVLDLPVPYLPIHILWINLMTDGLPALALAVEGEEPNIMERAPRARNEHIFTGKWGRLALGALVPFGISFILFLWELGRGASVEEARTITFTFAILFEVLFTFSIRSSLPFWHGGLFSNKWLIAAVSVPLALQLVLLYTDARHVFYLVPLTLAQWGLLAVIVFASFLFFEIVKSLQVTNTHQKMSRKKLAM